MPLLTDALASLECEIVAEHPAGDHWIVVGRTRLADGVGSTRRPELRFAREVQQRG